MYDLSHIPVAVTLAFLTSVFATVWVHAQAWLEDRESYMGWWTIAWVLHVARFVPTVVTGEISGASPLAGLAVLRDVALVWGTAAYLGRPNRRWLVAFPAVELVLALVVPAAARPLVGGIARLISVGVIWTTTANALWQDRRFPAPLRAAAGGGYMLFFLDLGIASAGVQTSVYFVLHVLSGVLVAYGISLMHLELHSQRRRAALAALATTMTHVVRTRSRVCRECRRIESDSHEWRRPEEFVGKRTNADISHGICPSCVTRYFGEYIDAAAERP